LRPHSELRSRVIPRQVRPGHFVTALGQTDDVPQTITRDQAGAALAGVLTQMAGPEARPREDQIHAVEALVCDRNRVLLVQATGWGKSAVYWGATAALRRAGHGPTLIISPLLALMRDQVEAAGRAGLAAGTINSANPDSWTDAFDALQSGSLDALLISPERLANPQFAEKALPLLRDTGLLVIDEAHCISDWGFDFRPDYQRVARLLSQTAPDAPVLATTATANARVTEDVASQLGASTVTLRGPLARSSLQLAVIPGLDGLARFAWVDEALPQLPGSGIVYSLTKDQAQSLAAYLHSRGHRVAAYTGDTDPADRARIEDQLRANELKAVVATSALGMGYDKPDLGFCVHVGSPDSPVAYYQQVGRAGRALPEAAGVLLPAAESDPQIWDYFATATVPDEQSAQRVLRLLGTAAEPRSVPSLEADTGVRRGRLENLLKVLQVDGAVQRVAGGWTTTGETWTYDAPKYQRLVAARRAEANLMAEYAGGHRCLMQVLTEALDDPASEKCGRCSACTGRLPAPGAAPDSAGLDAARQFLRQRDHPLPLRKMWPSGSGRRGRIQALDNGRAITFAAEPAWQSVAAELAGPDGEPSDELKAAAVAALTRWSRDWQRPVAVVPLPSPATSTRVAGLAAHVASVGRLPVMELLSSTDAAGAPRDPGGETSADQVKRLLASLTVTGPVDGSALSAGPLLLVADTWRTGWTATVSAALLRDAGAAGVTALIAHQRP
jgi:ATP-dependent DNA helicase RecQ